MQNGGTIRSDKRVNFGLQMSTNGATTTVTINDGLFEAGEHIFMGPGSGTGTGTFTLNGGEVRCDYFRVGGHAAAGRQELYLNGGTLYCRHLDHVGLANATEEGSAAVYFRGSVIKPGYRRNPAQGLTFGGADAPDAGDKALELLRLCELGGPAGGFTLALDADADLVLAMDRRLALEISSADAFAAWTDALVRAVRAVRERFAERFPVEEG